jgi:hypothetical protein
MSDEELGPVLDRFVAEALQLRMVSDLPVTAGTAAEAIAFLGTVRARLDRIEEMLSRVLRLRARAQRAHTVATAAADDAFDTAITRQRAAPVQSGGEFSSARERAALANLAVMDLLHAARRTALTAHMCDEAVDLIRLAYRGLDGLRTDTATLLRSLAFESHLER